MYIEKRKSGKHVKYYLVYSYREKSEVKKIRKYLGIDVSEEELKKRVKIAEAFIFNIIEEYNTKIFNFILTKKQIERLNAYDKKIRIHHLSDSDWQLFTEEFVYNTNAIEGSKVNLEEVKEIVEEKRKVNGSDEIETKNVAKAVKFIKTTKEKLSLELIKKIHNICFEGTKDFAGNFRTLSVVVMNSKGEIVHSGAPASQVKKLLEEMIEWYNKNKNRFKPLVIAGIIHNQFEHIHPFEDGNGRVGRLLLNYILLKNKYPPINILLNDRAEYYQILQKYSKEKDLKPTIEFLVKQYKKTLKSLKK
ncbi:MAG: Fic family protein [Nanobdellota archaeon]